MLNGKVIRVMWSHRDPDARKSGIGNLFVKVQLFRPKKISLTSVFFFFPFSFNTFIFLPFYCDFINWL